MSLKRFIALLLTVILAFSIISGCGGTETANGNDPGKKTEKPKEGENNGETPTGKKEDEIAEYIEVWTTNNGYLPVEKDSDMYNYYVDQFGVGLIQPYVEWNGGVTYLEQLNTRIASNDMPDMFLPVGNIELELAENGAILELSDLLSEKAPNLWNLIPEDVWGVAKSYDPHGQGGIYAIPGILGYGRTTGLIRKDWLDNLKLEMPTTQEDFVNVLKAFKNDDPNGNGEKDEIPTGGREEGRWMDHLFAMYGIAMDEGYPDWDIYDGELTYSAVTQNMKDALAFMNTLYKEGLMDPETFLNSKDEWEGKIISDKVGVYFHWGTGAVDVAFALESAFEFQPDISVLPAISAPGYEGFYTTKQFTNPVWVIKNQKDESKINACLEVLNQYADRSKWKDYYLGLQGMHWDIEDGVPEKLPDDRSIMQNIILTPYYNFDDLEFTLNTYNELNNVPENKWAMDQGIRNLEEQQKFVRPIAGDGLPAGIYGEHDDIKNRTLYVEYATKIIIGDFPIEKFDEFVDKWYSTGGEDVTAAAREWYAKTR